MPAHTSRSPAPWKMSSQIKRLTFTKKDGKIIRIGGNLFGNVYIGRLKFNEKGKPIRVAVKLFKNPISYKLAQSYAVTIQELRRAGVFIPKMGVVLIKTERNPEGEWAIVSQLFGSTSVGSKIVNHSAFHIRDPTAQIEAIRELTRIANAGFEPAHDVVEPFHDISKGSIVIDIDQLARHGMANISLRAKKIRFLVDFLARENPENRKKLLETMYREANPLLRKAILTARK